MRLCIFKMQAFQVVLKYNDTVAILFLNHYKSDAITEFRFNTAGVLRNYVGRAMEFIVSAGTKTFLAGVYKFVYGIGIDLNCAEQRRS